MGLFDRLSQSLSSQQRSLREQLRSNPYYRLQSLAEVPLAIAAGVSIDVNRATIDDWLRLPGISIHQARSLVQLTAIGVQFLCIEDVAAALSLSVQRLKPLEPLLNFSYYDRQFHPTRYNPNIATINQLEEIPILTPELITTILEQRETTGQYIDFVDFQKRLQLTPQQISQLFHYLIFE